MVVDEMRWRLTRNQTRSHIIPTMLKLYRRHDHAIAKAVESLEAYSVEPTVRQRLTSFLQDRLGTIAIS